MVSSAKKKRGKQRKAAKAQQAVATNSVPTVNNVEPAGVFGRTNFEDHILQNLLIQTLQKKVQSGHEAGTLALLTSFDSSTPGIVCEAVVPDVLNFLKQCEDETFDQVMASVGGDLVTPSIWIKLLFRTDELEPNCRLQITKNIGPLVRCMCNDTERLFFKSNKHWRDGILSFAVLIGGMIDTSVGSSTDENGTDKKLVETLLNYDGLLSSIIQWGYWDRRSDITTGLSNDDCARVVSIGRQLTGTFITNAMSNIISENDRDLLKSIGTTPIISKEYDPKCMVSFVVGLIRELKNERILKPLNPYVISILQPLMEEADCIDKDVIMEMIDLGMKRAHDYESAVVVARLSEFMLCQELNAEEGIESDTRIAFAIRSGIIEMCLNFVDRFRGHEAFGDDTEGESLYSHIESIFSKIYGISMHKKSWKAIDHKMVDVWDKLVCFEQNTDITNNPKCKKLLDMAVFILDNANRYCCRCNKSLSKTEAMECNGCHNMVYCSRDCQKEDWLNGHNVTCCKSYTDVIVGGAFGFFQGRVIPPTMPENERLATKLRELEKNITMIQLKLLLDHSETILNQAKALDLHLSDCVVSFDLFHCPPTIKTKSYTVWFNKPELKKAFEETRSKENIMCVYFSSIFYGELDEDDEIPVLQMQKLYPHEWLTNKK